MLTSKSTFTERWFGALLATIGLIVSAYALYVELKLDEIGGTYRPACDLSEYVSCSKALHSSFGIGLGLIEPIFGRNHLLYQKNPVFGIITFAVLILLQFYENKFSISISFAIAVILNILSVYLFGILVYLRTVCIVCVTIYVINFLILIRTFKRLRNYTTKSTRNTKKKSSSRKTI